MPGNEVRERVHNFFAQDSLSQGQHHSPVVDGNSPALSNVLGVGSQRQTGGLSSDAYNLQNCDTTRGRSSYPFNVQRGLDSAQSAPWAEFAKSQQPNSNGIMYGNQYYQTRQDESSFLPVNTGSNQCNLASGGSSFHELQRGAGLEQQARGLVRSEPSGSPVTFDLFGGQQMSCQQSNSLQSLQRQQSGLNEMQQLQQQVMFMKMQELQRQQQLQQLDAGPQNLLDQVSPVPKVASSSHSPTSINGTNNSGAVNFELATELGNTNWLQRGSPVLQGSANGFNPTNYGQAQHLMGLIPQHIDQSLYGIPVANSRGSLSQLPQVGTQKPAVQPMPTFSSSFPVNECAELSDQVSGQDGTSIHGQSLQGQSFFGHTVSQALSNAINNENLQQANNVQKSLALQDLCGGLDVTIPAETSQEKVAAQSSSLQNEVGLDPSEERFLFGSDSNIWGAFSKSLNRNEEGGNLFDSAGLLTGSPSIQGGTWSALMQSAVAETSSSDVGPQEECSGLNFHSAEISSGNQNPMYNSGRHKASSAEDKLPLAPSLNSFSGRPSDSTSMNNSCHNIQGNRFPHEQGQNLQENSQRPVQSSDGGSKWSDFGPLQTSVAEASQIFSNTSHPLDTEMVSRRGSCTLTPELGGARQPWMKSASLGVLGSAVPSGDTAFSIFSENSSKPLRDNNQKKFFQDEVFHGCVALKSSPRHNSAVDMEHVGSSMASPQGNSEVFSSYSATAPNSSTMKGGEETCQTLQNNNQSNYWKKADLVKSNVSEGLGFLQRHVMKDNRVLHTSPYAGDKKLKMHEIENSDKKDNSNDSYHSNLHPHSSAGGVRESALSDASDSRCLLMGKQKLSDQGGQKNSWPPKFQYHPLGNLGEDADPPCSMKQSTHSQSIGQHNPQHGQSKVFGQVPHRPAELEEGQLSDVLMDNKGSSEVHRQSRFPGGVSDIPGLFNRSLDLHSPNKVAESSPNMLQLIQKVDQSRECGPVAESGHSENEASSKMPEAKDSDENVGHYLRSQSAASQGFGLQLGPPSRRAPVRNHSLISQSSIQAVSSSHSSHAAVDTGEKNEGPMRPPHQAQSLFSPSDLSQEGFKNIRFGIPGSTDNVTSIYAMPRNLFPAFDSPSGFPYMGGQLKIPNVVGTTAQVSTNESMSVSFDKHASCHTEKGDSCRGSANGQSVEASLPDEADNTQDRPILPAGKSQSSNPNGTVESNFTNQVSSQEPVSVSQALLSGIGQQGMPSKMLSSLGATFPPSQPPFGSQHGKDPSHISQSHQLNIVESSLSAPERQSDQYLNRGNFASQIGTSSANSLISSEGEEQQAKESPPQQIPVRNVDLIQKMDDSQGREPSVKYISGGSPANSASMQRDIEAFGRSLKPNLSNQNYSLLNQMQAIKLVEIDPSNRAFKRIKVADSSTDAPQVLSGDTEMLGFSGPEDLQRSISSQQGRNMVPQDVLAPHQDDSLSSTRSNNTNSFTLEQTQNGPQLEPSWFNQCRTLKNGQMLHMYDARRAAAMKTMEQPFTIGKSSSSLHALNTMLQVIPATSDRSTIGDIGSNSVPSSAAIEHFPSPALPVNVDHQHLMLKPMKRKRAASESIPWHKKVSVDSRSSQTISLAEREWARVANRLTEKVKEGVDFNEEGAPGFKAKSRVILTTQLMQQLLPPPPAAILSAEANSEYESVAYSISRLALGDACSVVCCSNGDLNMPGDDKELLPEKCITSQRINKHYFAKAVEELLGRARRLESDFLRLDKRASVLDVIVDGQDQEKFAVINRYAKFLGRGQSGGIPQRYVRALPIPKDLPSGVHCLSL